MEKELETILTNMKDAGCEEKTLKTAELLFTEHDADAINRLLRRCRCSLIEELHEGQRKVDRLDYLIRQTEKNQKSSQTITREQKEIIRHDKDRRINADAGLGQNIPKE